MTQLEIYEKWCFSPTFRYAKSLHSLIYDVMIGLQTDWGILPTEFPKFRHISDQNNNIYFQNQGILILL